MGVNKWQIDLKKRSGGGERKKKANNLVTFYVYNSVCRPLLTQFLLLKLFWACMLS